jgi:hypothetical protein
MSMFIIDSENNIAAHAAVPSNPGKRAGVREREGTGEARHRMAGRAPRGYLEFVRRRGAVHGSEIGQEVHGPEGGSPATVARRCATGERRAPEPARSKKSPAKAPRRARAQKGAKGTEERSNKKAEVIAMMKRAKGVTLAEIMEATSWHLRSKGATEDRALVHKHEIPCTLRGRKVTPEISAAVYTLPSTRFERKNLDNAVFVVADDCRGAEQNGVAAR